MNENFSNIKTYSILDLFKSLKEERKLFIPNYQRPYSWDVDNADQLLEDLWSFYQNNSDPKGTNTYFLGSLVMFLNDEKTQLEIIDGQQRLTTVTLLARAIYTLLEENEIKDKKIDTLMEKISSILWVIDNLTNEPKEPKEMLLNLDENVMEEKNISIFKSIINGKKIDEKSKDNYTRNYLHFLKRIKELSSENQQGLIDFYTIIIQNTRFFTIEVNNLESALLIFSTLNDRGIPLSDEDIFKANIFKNKENGEEKDKFLKDWKSLNESARESGETIQKLFIYYMFYSRALENDISTTTPGLRKYFLEKKNDGNVRLYDKNVLETLKRISKFFDVIVQNEEIEGENWTSNLEILKKLDILYLYPNEFWKYPVITFYLTHSSNEKFEEKFDKFLGKLIYTVVRKYVEVPSLNGIKAGILKLNANIVNSMEPDFAFTFESNEDFKKKIIVPHINITSLILRIFAYSSEEQLELLPKKTQIEHILPRNWDGISVEKLGANTKKEVDACIKKIGNLLPLEKPVNSKASNHFLSGKHEKYEKSSILYVLKFNRENKEKDIWTISDIEERTLRVQNEIIAILDNWFNKTE
ncbi:DUF262 domain-containing protein [Mycoplasma procyoni]|uniref:DUF262 domain-containing protein n=1 Tax=Mycoplasma procyoni TaxID=568784 RepID=UPI00197BE86E|nr:DUF262 domain-containing protein [Mycoplasma procyoni]MBN3534382.1 DUF262 domain-containing protein [Mycoplasma procyoni]